MADDTWSLNLSFLWRRITPAGTAGLAAKVAIGLGISESTDAKSANVPLLVLLTVCAL